MKIGIEGAVLANQRGFGRMARLSLDALAAACGDRHELVVIVDRPSSQSVVLPPNCRPLVVDVQDAPATAASARSRRSIADLWAMSRAAARARLDVLWFPTTYMYFPVYNIPRIAVTVHDALPMLHPELVFPTWQGRVAWSLKERVAVHQASLVLTPSEASRRDVARVFRLNPAAIRVVPEAADPVFRPTADDDASTNALNSYGIPSEAPYFLYVGGLSPHKNLLRLIEAFALGAPPTTRLVLVGDLRDNFHTHVPELRALIEKLALSNRVIFTGFVPDDQLALLYGRALALVQPSLLEGFGLPPVEAMACGTPVLHSTAGSLPEVIAGAGLAFDPLNVQAQAEAIRRISADPDLRADLAWRALERAAHFNWSRVGDQLLGAFESLGTQRPRAASA